MPYELVYRAVTERATITPRVLLRAGRCYRLTGYAQEMCSALGFIAGLRNGHMQEHLRSTRACDCAEAPGTEYTQNDRVVFTAAVRDCPLSLAESPALSVHAETSRLCVERLRWVGMLLWPCC